MERRRKIRALEAKRDNLMGQIGKSRVTLAEVRAALKVMRRSR